MIHNYKNLLVKYDRLPDLLKLAWERKEKAGDPLFDVYQAQDQLAKEHEMQGKPYLWSMPYRHLYHCGMCGASSTEFERRVVNPAYRQGERLSAEIMESELHAIRCHNAPIPKLLKAVLISIK